MSTERLHLLKIFVSLHTKPKLVRIMTAIQMNAELFRQLSIIAEDASLSAKLMKYIKKLTAQKQDQTLMTKEEFFAKVDKSLEQARQGRVHRMQQGESLDDFLRRVG